MEFFTSRQSQLDAERRRKDRTIADGEHVRFDLMMRDGSSPGVFLTDGVEASSAKVHAKICQMTGRTPVAVSDRVTQITNEVKAADEEKRRQNALAVNDAIARYAAPRTPVADADPQGRAVVEAVRAARYR